MKHTLAGIPVELSVDAPRDKIVAHPDVIAQIEAMAFKRGPVTLEHLTPEDFSHSAF